MARVTDPRVTVDPVAVLVRQYKLVLANIARRLTLGELRADSYLAAQVPYILKELKKLDIFAAAWAQRQLPAAYKAGAKAAQAELVAAGTPLITAGFTGFDAAAASALVARTSSNLANVQAALVQGLLGGEKPTSAKAVGLMREALARDGRVQVVQGALKIQTPSGAMWDASKYAKMEAKTATYDSLRVARRARYLQNGTDIVVVTSTGTDHEVCAVWEGQQLSLTGATPGLPTPEDARAEGLFHPNCEHSYIVDKDAEQPGGDLTQEEEPNFPTLGEKPSTVRVGVTSRIRSKIAGILSR